MSNSFELVDVIKQLRKDITQAAYYAEGQDLRFNVKNIEVELQTVVKKEGNGGLKFKVLGIGAEAGGKYEHAKTHTLKFQLEPILFKEDEQGKRTKNAVHINDKANVNDKA